MTRLLHTPAHSIYSKGTLDSCPRYLRPSPFLPSHCRAFQAKLQEPWYILKAHLFPARRTIVILIFPPPCTKAFKSLPPFPIISFSCSSEHNSSTPKYFHIQIESITYHQVSPKVVYLCLVVSSNFKPNIHHLEKIKDTLHLPHSSYIISWATFHPVSLPLVSFHNSLVLYLPSLLSSGPDQTEIPLFPSIWSQFVLQIP